MSNERYLIKRKHSDIIAIEILFKSHSRATVVKEGLESESDTATEYEVTTIEITDE